MCTARAKEGEQRNVLLLCCIWANGNAAPTTTKKEARSSRSLVGGTAARARWRAERNMHLWLTYSDVE